MNNSSYPASEIELKTVGDYRGNLVVGEFNKDIPFAVERFFAIYSVPDKQIRGEHAHKKCHQFLLAISGSCRVRVNDGFSDTEFLLSLPSRGLHIPPMNWGVQYEYSSDAVLLVFASHSYEDEDYIRSYEEFASMINSSAGPGRT